MKKPDAFSFSIPADPEGIPLSGSSAERLLIDQLKASGGLRKDTLWNLVCFYNRSGRVKEGRSCVDRLFRLERSAEKRAACLFALGQLMEKQADYAAAAGNYAEALRRHPKELHLLYFIHNNLGYSFNQLGRYREAEPCLRTALGIDPNRSNAYKNLGLCCQGLGRHVEAARWFVAATTVNALDPRSLGHLEDLLRSHPEVLADDPELRNRLAEVREAVAYAGEFGRLWKEQRRRRN